MKISELDAVLNKALRLRSASRSAVESADTALRGAQDARDTAERLVSDLEHELVEATSHAGDPIVALCAAVIEAIQAYDRTRDHSRHEASETDCIRCKLLDALPAYAQREVSRR